MTSFIVVLKRSICRTPVVAAGWVCACACVRDIDAGHPASDRYVTPEASNAVVLPNTAWEMMVLFMVSSVEAPLKMEDSKFMVLRSARAVQYRFETLRRDGKAGHRARHAYRIVDRRGNRSAHPRDSALARPFHAERVERTGGVLRNDNIDHRGLADGGQQVIGKGDRQRLAALV